MAIVVTVKHYNKGNRRYVVVSEDEGLFTDVPTGKVPEPEGTPASNGVRPPSISDIRSAREERLGRFSFGCRWVRAFGKVDEMYCTVSTWEVIKVERITDAKVWGR